MKITALKQQIKNPQRVSVFVDEKYSFSLSLDELVAQKLKKDQELSEVDVKRLKKISDDGKLRARSLEWLLNRPHSVREFKDYLYRKKADSELVSTLIQEFIDRRYLDEQKFGEWLVDLHQRRGKSNRAIRAELMGKGLDREAVEIVMQETGDTESARLKELIAKKQKLSRYVKDPSKLIKYLTSQGFDYQLVKGILAGKDKNS